MANEVKISELAVRAAGELLDSDYVPIYCPAEVALADQNQRATLPAVKTKLGVLLDNFAATAAPTSSDDSGKGYAAGSLWLWPVEKRLWVCVSPAPSAASWLELTRTGVAADNLAASAAPLPGNDNTEGYGPGSHWLWPSAERLWICMSAGTNIAVWVEAVAGDGLSASDIDTLAKLNAIVGDATLADTTAGTAGNLAVWDAGGALVDGGAVPSGGGGTGGGGVSAAASTEEAQYDAVSGLDRLSTADKALGDLRILDHLPAVATEEPGAGQLFRLVGQVLPGTGYGSVNLTTNSFSASGSNIWQTGQAVVVRNSGGALPGGLSADTLYFLCKLSSTSFNLHLTLADAHANTATVDVTSPGTGTTTFLEANYPYEVVPADYDAATNARVWRKVEMDPLMVVPLELVPPTELLMAYEYYFAWMVPFDAVVESVVLTSFATAPPVPSPAVDVQVNGIGALRGGPAYLTTPGALGSFSLEAVYTRLQHRTDFKPDLRLLSEGDLLDGYVADDGSASSGGVASGLQMTLVLRPLRTVGAGGLYTIT